MRTLVSVKADSPLSSSYLERGFAGNCMSSLTTQMLVRSREDGAELVVAERRKNRKTERQKCQMKTIQ